MNRTSSFRTIIVAFDLCFAGLIALALTLALPQRAFAYVDPSVMTYTIQALAGVAVALSTVLGVAWRRSRKKVMNLLGIDENARKDVEPDCHRVVDGQVRLNAYESAEAKPAEKEEGSSDYRVKWIARLGYGLIFGVLVALTLYALPSSEIIASNSGDLTVNLANVWTVIAIPAIVGALALALLTSLVPGKPFHVVISVLFSIALAAYLQALLLNRGLPAADGSTIDLLEHWKITLASTVVWLAILIVPLVLMSKRPTAWRRIVGVLAFALIVAQGIELGATTMSSAYASTEKPAELHVTEDGLYEVAPQNNIVYFVLDTYDLIYADELLQNNPEYFGPLEDFTYYRNSSGTMIPTRNALPCMLSGRMPHNEEEMNSFLEYLYDGDTPIDRLADAGYSVGIYSDAAYMDEGSEKRRALAEKTQNIHDLDSIKIDFAGGVRILSKCSLYREVPWLFKPFFWYYSTEIDNNLILNGEGYDPARTPYTIDDPLYYSKLKELRLSIDDSLRGGSMRFIHLQGPHPPFDMDQNGERIAESTVEQQTRGSMVIVNEYLEQLKELGIYDDTSIVITADHGVVLDSVRNINETDTPGMATCPAIFYKPPKDNGKARQPMQVSDSPVCSLDIAPTFLRDAGIEYSKFGTTLTDEYDPLRPRIYNQLFLEDDTKEHNFQYSIEGYAGDLSNWHFTGLIMTRHFQ